VLWRPMRRRKAGFVSLILISVGVAFVLRHLLLWFFGPGHRRYDVDVFQVHEVFGLRIAQSQLVAVIGGAILMTAVGAVLAKTLLGKGMRALADSPELASVAGININRMVIYVWVLAGSLAGFAGVLQGLLLDSFTPNLGFQLLLPIFAAVILGGIGNPYGALLGGMVLGLTMELSTWSVFLGGVPPLYKPVIAFVVLIIVLLFRPEGILGKARTI
jgi:neutral amino acid transport system permease protein